jgi:hypothetical protein
MSLRRWLENGWLIEHKTSAREIADLLAVADRDLKASRTSGLDADWRLTIAYNAALQAATAALAACGYRAAREAHHYRVVQSLAFTIGAETALVKQFDQFRKKRNIGAYERAGLVSDYEAGEMFRLASRLRTIVEDWLHREHPALLGG